MIDIAMEDKPVLSTGSTDRQAFLRALYGSSPDNLYLELRCIHPTTSEVRTLWGKPGNKHEIATALKHVEALNREGFGVYFAPCLRKAKQGNAAAAALVPALWIDLDCSGNAVERERALVKMQTFAPSPSAIVDSGGGLHGYWLLETPLVLENDGAREKIAGLLRGLFAALGGDDAYVKTVAGIMRLPDTVNTKPERGGVRVHIIELHPERCYPVAAFEWLAAPLKAEKIGGLTVTTLNENGQHSLPARTEQYLSSGATNGQRNEELFAAACQLRDAGHSQVEAERDLIARYLADGNGSENAAGREREARATIASAYSQLPREPIRTAKERVDDLVQRYERAAAEAERPTLDQVREAVKACAPLDPLEWAEKRKRIRAVCDDTFRAEDLNRMYQQARREYDREHGQTEIAVNNGRYLELDGAILYERQTERGVTRQPVTDWTGRVMEWITRVDDDGQEEHIMRLQLQHAMHRTTLDVPSELFGDANALLRFITQRAGAIYVVFPAMHRHLAKAVISLSDTYPKRVTYRFIGWTKHEEQWTYVSPEMSVSGNGSLGEPPEVELETRLRDYRLHQASWEDSLAAFNAALKVFPKPMAAALVSFALLPIAQRFFPPAAPRPAVHLAGTSGSGKSEIAALMTSFYGSFTRDTPPAQWGDTINTVEVLGYALADALFWVDDWKHCYADERTFTRFLQSYSRGMGRGRLTKDAKLRQERPCRGLLLSTGETTLEGEASVLSRMLVLEVPPWERRDPGGKALANAETLREYLSGFTAHFARWVAERADAGTLTKELARQYEISVKGYRDKLNARLGRQANTGRVIGNWAVLVTVYRLLSNFLQERDAGDELPGWQDCIIETVKAVQQERAGQMFIDALGQLLASGQVLITDSHNPEEPRPGVTIIGYSDEQFIYLLPEVAYREVSRVQPLKFSAAAIGSQLREDSWLVSGSSESHLTVQMRIRGHRTRVWRLKAEILSGDGGDSGDGVTGDKTQRTE